MQDKVRKMTEEEALAERFEAAEKLTHEQLLIQWKNADTLIWILTEYLAKERENNKKLRAEVSELEATHEH